MNDNMKKTEILENVIDKFCNNAKVDGENIAVIYFDEKISYRELDEKSTLMAGRLRSEGVIKDDVVGVMVDRTIDLIICVLGIMKAGGTYLPLDTIYPVERINYILEDSRCQFLLLNSSLNEEIVFQGIILDIRDKREIEFNFDYQTMSRDSTAYIMYTSGSTGVPKGVPISHEALTSFLKGISKRIPFQSNDRILAVTTISFDISILELVIPLAMGITIVLADSRIGRNPRLLVEYIKTKEVSIIQMTPTRMSLLLECVDDDWVKSVRTILIGGESFSMNLLERLKNICDARIFNMYGPTECTIWVSVAELTNEHLIDIGTPLEGTELIILDEEQKPVKQGEIGEICVVGKQLSRGYLNKLELTKKKFITISNDPDIIIYRTGDYGCVLSNGNFVCKGRIDEQVKIRGYRIEINEIEQRLLQYPGINKAVVIAMSGKNDTKYLCTYYESRLVLKESELRKYLKKFLPYYMIPEQFIWMECLPETLNQKIDKRLLMTKGV